MKLYYCPAYTGFVYTESKKILFNEKIVDTAAFVEELKLHAGLTSEKKDDVERIVNYYKAIKTYMQKNPCNVLKASFDVDSLSVAKECLSWRDSLTFAGWIIGKLFSCAKIFTGGGKSLCPRPFGLSG